MNPSYDPAKIVDAPEFHGLARSLGTLTWGAWDHTSRTFEERKADFVAAHPPEDPLRYMEPRLQQEPSGPNTFVPPPTKHRNEQLQTWTFDTGTIHDLLARFGLRLTDGPPLERWRKSSEGVALAPRRDLARRRNYKLRVLHGKADIEPTDMDAAKAEYIEHQEKKRAAREVREARRRMREELSSQRGTD